MRSREQQGRPRTATATAARARIAIGTGMLALAAALLALSPAASAAPRGSESVQRSGTLATSGQSMWGAGGSGPSEKEISLFDLKWNKSASGGKIVHIEDEFTVCNVWKTTEEAFVKFFTEGKTTTECSEYKTYNVDIGDFGAEGEASTSGEIGMSLKLHGFNKGTIGVTYPVTATYTIPKRYSFAAGEAVSIKTSEAVDSAAALETAFPALKSTELDGTFGVHFGASGKLCIFACVSKSLLEFGLPEDYNGSNPFTQKLLEVNTPETACFDFIANFLLGFGHAPAQYTRCHNEETGVNSGYISLPNVKTTSTLEKDGSLAAKGEDPYVVVPISAVTWATRLLLGGKTLPLNFGPAKIPGTSANFGYETLQQVLTDIETMRQVFTFKPAVDTTMQWGQSMGYVVKNGEGHVVSEGTGVAASFPLGDTLTLSTPASLHGPLTITPGLTMAKAEISNDTENLSIGEGEFSALSLTLETPSAEYDKVKVWPGSEIKLGPVYRKPFPLATTPSNVFKETWTLGGFNAPQLSDLTLTPDPPPVPTALTVNPVEGLSYEGTIAEFLDPEPTSNAADYAVTIQWGDGAREAGALTEVHANAEGTLFAVTAGHTYAEEGEYPLAVTIADGDTPALTVTDRSTAQVSDAPLHATAPTPAGAGEEALLWQEPSSPHTLARFTDEDPGGTLTDYSASVQWGDGSTSAGEVIETAPGSSEWEVRAGHSYGTEDLGPHTVTVTIRDAGGSTAVEHLPVIAYASSEGGEFAIAPAPIGQHVSFWSARWSQQNPLLAAAPASFKGWIGGSGSGSAPQPTCEGGTWSTAPGNSSRPPASVPSYLAVLEASSAAQHGARISGSSNGIAIVAVSPGYGPNPGHPGVGTVVAHACPAAP